jgi:hypothetical protein
MTHHKRPLLFLLVSIVLLAILLGMLFFFPPTLLIPGIPIQITLFYLFFPLVFGFLFFGASYALNNKMQGVLVGLFAITYLLFRLNNLTHPFFFFLLAILFVALGFLFNYRK